MPWCMEQPSLAVEDLVHACRNKLEIEVRVPPSPQAKGRSGGQASQEPIGCDAICCLSTHLCGSPSLGRAARKKVPDKTR